MAGIAKPSIEGLGEEVGIKIINFLLDSGTSAHGLIDGTQPNEWNTARVAYWEKTGSFVEIEIPRKSNIWRSGTSSWSASNKKLRIMKKIGGIFVDVTDLHTIETTPINNTQWEKFAYNLDAGVYRFEHYEGLRMDSEWYVELAVIKKHLIKSSNKIHILSNDTLTYPNIQEPLSQEMYEKWGMDTLEGYESEISKVAYEMDEGGEVGDGRVVRKTINKNDWKINSLEVK